MVEELKIIADVLTGLTTGAIYGVLAYLVLEFLKVLAIAYFAFAALKAIFASMFKPAGSINLRKQDDKSA